MAKGKKTGGRSAGTPNKLTLSIKDAVLETFRNLGGVTHMVAWATDNPSDFYRIAAKLIPQQIQADITHKNASELPDSELEHIATGGSAGAAKEAVSETESAQLH